MADRASMLAAQRAKARYQARRAAGLCPKCGGQRDTQRVYCSPCAAMVRRSKTGAEA